MRRVKTKLILAAKKVTDPFRGRALPTKCVHEDVPYFSQWESPELVEDIITNKLDARQDTRWQSSGAGTVEEYAEWSRNGCGMACLKMILAAHNQLIPLAELGKRSLEYGVYQLPLDHSPGMFYKPFVRFVEQEFGMNARSNSALTMIEIKRTLSKGGLVIASVTPEIRFSDKTPKKRGGHLVLVVGYDEDKKVFYIHNPSGFVGNQRYVEVSYDMFAQFFDHKGIEVYNFV